MLMLDLLQYITGQDFIGNIRSEYEPKKYVIRLNPENEVFNKMKNKIPDELQDSVFQIFNDLAVLKTEDFAKISE